MPTIEGAHASSGDYSATTQVTDEQKTQEIAPASVSEPLQNDGISAEIQTGKVAKTKSTVTEKLIDAVVRVVVAVVDLLDSVLSSSRGDRNPGSQKPVNHSPNPPTTTKPGSTVKPQPPVEKPSTTPTTPKRLEAIQDDKGVVTVRTLDGFTVRAEGKEAAWGITSPDGKTTRIFGDPHVKESDGDRWDFKKRSSFVFGSNKVTVETVPNKNGNTVSSRITIYSGSERVTIGGVDKNRPTILALASDGQQHDDGLSDGDLFTRNSTKKGESWSVVQNGKKRVMGAK